MCADRRSWCRDGVSEDDVVRERGGGGDDADDCWARWCMWKHEY